jgi:lysozyme family protein
MPDFDSTRDDYRKHWDAAKIDPERLHGSAAAAAKVLEGRRHYEAVSAALGVPWYFTGCAHMRESYCSFATHLHNGDSLKARTHHVPAGRPAAPPANGVCYTWDESAIDALRIKGLQNVTDWSLERVLYELERFNGFGYRNKGRPSPYLWAGTDQYHAGKYVRDGVYDPSFVDPQAGCCAVLKLLLEGDPHLFGEAPEVADAINSPKAGNENEDEPLTNHVEVHQQLQQESWWYSLKNGLRKKLGLPVAGGVGASTLVDDPIGAVQQVANFAKTYGLHIMAAVVAVLLVIEGVNAVQRQRKIDQ